MSSRLQERLELQATPCGTQLDCHGAADVFFAVSELKMLSFSVMLSYIWLGLLVSSAALTSVVSTLEIARWSHKAIARQSCKGSCKYNTYVYTSAAPSLIC